MKKEDIEKEAMLRFNIGEPTCGIEKFIEGANWRINSVWHDKLKEAQTRKCIMVKFTNGLFMLFEDARELKGIEDNVESFAYIEDLIPTKKE